MENLMRDILSVLLPANMLADMGYAVFAADLFGAGVRPTEVKDKRQHTGELYKDRAKMRALLQGALKTAGSKGANVHNAVAMGYCFGGAPVLEFARSGADLKGFVTFHGGLKTPAGQDYSKTKGKLLILHGTADTNICNSHAHLPWILSYSQHISIMLSPLI
jgi:dienelactone hydrolase